MAADSSDSTSTPSPITSTADVGTAPPTSAIIARQRPQVSLHVPSRMVLKVLLLLTLFYAGVQILQQLAPFFLSLSVAAFLAVAADPAVRALQARGLGRGTSVAALMVALLLVLGVFVSLFVPPLVDQGNRIVNNAPQQIRDVRDNDTYQRFDQRFNVFDRAAEQLEKLPARVSSEIGTVLTAVLAGVFGTLTILFMMVLLLLSGGKLVEGTARLFPQIAERRWWTLVQGAYRSIGAYVAGTLTVAFVAGATLTLMLLVLGVPYPLPLGLWMLMFAIVPLVGATIGALPALVVAFAAGSMWKGLILLAFVVIYQQVENLYIQPKIQGKVVSLPPVVIFLSVLIGAQLMGVLGALFAVPVAGVIQIVLRQYLDERDDTETEVELPPIAPDEAPGPPDVAPAH